MSLLSEAQADEKRPGATCSVGIMLVGLPDAGRAELVEALAATVQATALSRILKRHDLELGPDAIRRHRNGDCQCPS